MRSTNSQITTWYLLTSVVIACASLTDVGGAPNPVPLINQPVLPAAIAPNSPGFKLTVNGTGFVTGSVVNWNGNPRTSLSFPRTLHKARRAAARFVPAIGQ